MSFPVWPLLALLTGFAGLVWSADRFVAGSAALAHRLGVSRLVIGLTIVAFGTSAPEILVSISAAVHDTGELAVGNALGSNIANMGLVLAITALMARLPVKRHLRQREVPALLATTALAGLVLLDGHLGRLEGGALILALIGIMTLLSVYRRRQQPEEIEGDIPDYTGTAALLWFLLGLALLIASAEILVWGARELALAIGVSPLIVGLTAVAIGTSLPELAAAVASVRRGHQDLALGNIIGSNLFNLLAVMAIPGLIQQPVMESAVFFRDYGVMAAMTLLLALPLWRTHRRRSGPTTPDDTVAYLGKPLGLALLLMFAGYYLWLFFHL